jgi:diadenosine tetraphosphate (Ap4A) HIT family hydrolase
MVERIQRPRRCYLAATGSNSDVGELTQSSRHLHMHVIPIYESEDRPSSVFSWSEGVYVGEPSEWAELLAVYREEWKSCAW